MMHRFGNEGCESFLFSLFFSGLTADKSHSSETSDRTGWSKFIFHLPIMLLKWRVTELFLLHLNAALPSSRSFACCCLELGKTSFLPSPQAQGSVRLPLHLLPTAVSCLCWNHLHPAQQQADGAPPASLQPFPCHIFLAALAISTLVHCSSC